MPHSIADLSSYFVKGESAVTLPVYSTTIGPTSTSLHVADCPVEIKKALVKAMLECEEPKKSGHNDYDGYDYATIDDVLAVTRPACAKNGLIIYMVETGQEWIQALHKGEEVDAARYTFEFMFLHESGAQWQNPRDVRQITLRRSGPQTGGIAKSYVLKAFLKALFQISTGEPDGDHMASEGEELDRSPKRGRKPKEPPTVIMNEVNKPLPPLVQKTAKGPLAT